MGMHKAGQENVRQLTKNSTGTYQISLPINLIRVFKWQEGQKLTVKPQGKKLIIEDWKE